MNKTELFISDFYQSLNVAETSLCTIATITERLNMKKLYWSHSSTIATHNDRYIVFINESINVQQQWQEFGHEMSHYFFDECRYDKLINSYAAYGETKADYFAYHFCVPTFMLQKLKGVDVYKIMNLFNVEYDFAMRRLEMYESKLIERRNKYAWSYK